MKRLGMNVSVIVLALMIASGFTAYCAKEKPTEQIWVDDIPAQGSNPAQPPRQMARGPEMMEAILAKIAEKDPDAAQRLRELHEEDPQAFRAEIHEYMQQHDLGSVQPMRGQQQQQRRGKALSGGGRDGFGRNNDAPVGRPMQDMQKKHQEFVEWLEANYPEDANELNKLKTENPRLYMQKVMQKYRRYSPIMQVSKENPQLAKVMQQNEKLKDQRNEILEKLRTADDKEKETLTSQLREIVSQRFDLIVKRKQIQHDELLKKLERIKKDIEKSEAEVDKWKTSKDERVDERLKELLEKTEKFRWD